MAPGEQRDDRTRALTRREDGCQRCGRPRGRPGGHLVGRASASSTQASWTEGGGRGTERTRLQDWVLVNRKGMFTEHALLLLPERWLADVSAAGAAPCSSPGMKTGRCLDAAHHRCTCVPKARAVSLPRCVPWHGLCQKHLPVHMGWTPGQQPGARGGSEVAHWTVTKAHTHRAPQ